MDKIETWEYSLRQFIDIATRWSIHSIKLQTYPPNSPFSSVLWPFVKDATEHFDGFKSELRDQFKQAPYPTRLETDIKSRFMAGIDHYLGWYNDHKSEIEAEGFGEYDPYRSMLNVIESTREQIFLWFPETKKSKAGSPTAAHKALFVYYLAEGKYIVLPKKSEWEGFFSKYKLTGSWQSSRNCFISMRKGNGRASKAVGPMTLKNLSYVIENMLLDFPRSKEKAKNDFYEMEKELS